MSDAARRLLRASFTHSRIKRASRLRSTKKTGFRVNRARLWTRRGGRGTAELGARTCMTFSSSSLVTFWMVPAARAVRVTAEARRARCTRRGAAAMALLDPSVEAARAAGAAAQRGAETANMAWRGGPLYKRKAGGSRGGASRCGGRARKVWRGDTGAPRDENPSRRSVALVKALNTCLGLSGSLFSSQHASPSIARLGEPFRWRATFVEPRVLHIYSCRRTAPAHSVERSTRRADPAREVRGDHSASDPFRGPSRERVRTSRGTTRVTHSLR